MAVTAVLTLYFRSSSNLSSNLWIFFFSMWILFVSWADVSSSFSSSQEPRDELRLRLERFTAIRLTFPWAAPFPRLVDTQNHVECFYLTNECAFGGEGGTSVSSRYCWHCP